MNILSITSTKTMTYDAAASAQAFGIVEKLVRIAGAVLRAVLAFRTARPRGFERTSPFPNATGSVRL